MKNVVITVSESMSEKTYATLLDGIKTKFGEDIKVTKRVDTSLIGGFVLNVDGVVYDNSISSQLNLINKEMNSQR